jgi:ribA/ribD-fused uncharacterized protein
LNIIDHNNSVIIDEFQGEHRWLSNFWPAAVYLKSIRYPTVEHAYQAAKTLNPDMRERILLAPTPAEAKRLGRTVTLRKDWNTVKDRMMYDFVEQKFCYIPELMHKLLATGDAILIEGNMWHDNYWGECQCMRCYELTAQNKLGEILMDIRRRLREAQDS